MSVYPVILCGGSGTRLWPSSQPSHPKQFIALVGERSSFQETVARMGGVRGARDPIIVAGERHAKIVEDQLSALGVEAVVLLEPEARDSAPAIAAAAMWIAAHDPQGMAVIVSSDHHIPDAAGFQAAAGRALTLAEQGWIVTLGLRPTGPSTAFGYIKPADALLSGGAGHPVAAFVEKPDEATAVTYIAGGYLWNSGNFVCSAARLIEEFDRHAPAVSSAARAAVQSARTRRRGPTSVVCLGGEFAQAPKISLDYAVMERTDRAAVVAADFAWSDLGAWDAVKAASTSDGAGNSVSGSAVLVDTNNCLVRVGGDVQVGLVGVSDLAVVVEPGAVLVTRLAASQSVKRLADRMALRPELADQPTDDLTVHAERLTRWLATSALPLWWALGADHIVGGFREAIEHDGRPTNAPRRTRVAARQVFVYASTSGRWPGPSRAAVDHGLDYLLRNFRRSDGLYRALVTPDGDPLNESAYLYEQAFVLLALSSVFKLDPDRDDLRQAGRDVLDQVRLTFGHASGGFREVSEQPFQSNPLMHLLEVALAWIDAGGGDVWQALAEEIARLAIDRLIDPETGAIGEYFTQDWAMAAGADGQVVWPGHQFEWAFLLDRWAQRSGDERAKLAAHRLYAVGDAGVDPMRSVAVDAIDRRFGVTDARARLWPQTERLRAALTLSADASGERRRAMLADAADAARGLWRYLDNPVSGLWRDRMRPDGTFDPGPAPGSSLYHLVGAIAALARFAGPDAAWGDLDRAL